ncbi:MAG: hypothetical protein WC356_02725 [Candidatus Micrarchaeia archaeon]|jgi:hypothetical protein
MELIKEKELFPKIKTGETMPVYIDRRLTDLEKIIENQNRRINWLLKRINKGDAITDTFAAAGGETVSVENGIVIGVV